MAFSRLFVTGNACCFQKNIAQKRDIVRRIAEENSSSGME
jgi:hypothetical protein